jgi:hypothetical protein
LKSVLEREICVLMVKDFEVEAKIVDLLCCLASVSDIVFLLSKEEIELLYKSIGECDDGCVNLKETIVSRLKKFLDHIGCGYLV